MSSDLRIVWDGVEYAVPFPLSPRERVRVREWTGLRGDVDYQQAFEAGDASLLAALVIVAKRRKGEDVDPDAILDDAEFDTKLGDPNVGEEDPPTVPAGDADASDPSGSTTTPEATGIPS